MSKAPDPLEAELVALRPLEPTPELRQRIAEGLDEVLPSTRRIWWFALAAGVAAACLAILFRTWDGRRADSRPEIVRQGPAPPAAVPESAPTVLSYQRALARSPEEFDARLNHDALVASQSDPEMLRIGAFTRSDAALHALLGDD